MERVFNGLQAFICGTLFAFFSSANPVTAAIVTFDFEELAIGSYPGALVSNGFVFDPGTVDWAPDAQGWIGHYHIADPTESLNANNGTQYLIFDYFFDSSDLHIYGEAGGVFGVRQFDLAEQAFPGTCGPNRELSCGVTFVGYLADGGTISHTVILDGISDGTGSLNDFETFTFDGQWNRLTMFSIVSNDDYLNPGLDNLVLRTVPEPTTLALLGLGLAGLCWSSRKKG